MPGFSLPVYGLIVSMWRAYQHGVMPGPGCREDQNPNLLRAFQVLEAAEGEAMESDRQSARAANEARQRAEQQELQRVTRRR